MEKMDKWIAGKLVPSHFVNTPFRQPIRMLNQLLSPRPAVVAQVDEMTSWQIIKLMK